MDNYIPSEIEGLIAATSKLKDALVSVQNDLASQVIGKCFKIKGITNARIVAVNPETKKIVFETVESNSRAEAMDYVSKHKGSKYKSVKSI